MNIPFLVNVNISDLSIRKGQGSDYDRAQFIPIRMYTNMEVRNGKDSSAGWGRLKSGMVSRSRWISSVGFKKTVSGECFLYRPFFYWQLFLLILSHIPQVHRIQDVLLQQSDPPAASFYCPSPIGDRGSW